MFRATPRIVAGLLLALVVLPPVLGCSSTVVGPMTGGGIGGEFRIPTSAGGSSGGDGGAGGVVATAGTTGGGGSPGGGGAGGATTGPWPMRQPDARGCCAPDATMSGCMYLGGAAPQGCYALCDFYCSTNWRIENDSQGCPTWRYDLRSPGSGDDPLCFPSPDAGHRGDSGLD